MFLRFYPMEYTILWFTVTFSIPERTETILVLSQLDACFFRSVSSAVEWSFNFKLFRVGSKEAMGSSTLSTMLPCSVTSRVILPLGDYVARWDPLTHSPIHIRLDRSG